jgi:RNA polymerase sigma-70 factor (ECF subfamily)
VTSAPDDAELVAALRRGDEAAFAGLVDELSGPLIRLALAHVPSRAIAEEVVQDTWIGVIRGLDRFEGRSSLRTWIFKILVNIAKTKGQREARSIPFASLWTPGDDEPSVDPGRFQPADARAPGHWAEPPADWGPEDRLVARETLARVAAAIETLPPNQREVIRLRDVLGWSSAEVRNALDLSETNQRVLLHRARAKVRGALERYLTSGEGDGE